MVFTITYLGQIDSKYVFYICMYICPILHFFTGIFKRKLKIPQTLGITSLFTTLQNLHSLFSGSGGRVGGEGEFRSPLSRRRSGGRRGGGAEESKSPLSRQKAGQKAEESKSLLSRRKAGRRGRRV